MIIAILWFFLGFIVALISTRFILADENDGDRSGPAAIAFLFIVCWLFSPLVFAGMAVYGLLWAIGHALVPFVRP